VGTQPDGDVFVSPTKPGNERLEPRLRTVRNDAPHGRLNAVDQETDSMPSNIPLHELRSRSSNLSGRHHVGNVDAQGVYPSTACVFVAKYVANGFLSHVPMADLQQSLPQPRDDQALEAAVTREFSKFGTVFVKIRRDMNKMPFAFCQFTVRSLRISVAQMDH
jgi:polyadenylate-binding protein